MGDLGLPPMERRKMGTSAFGPIDDLDRRIIAELQRDPRLRVAELGRRVGLSAPAAGERMRRLREQGVISFRVEVAPRALGYSIQAVVRVSPQSVGLHRIPEIARDTPEITECSRITGEDCYVMTLHVRSVDDLEPILDRFTPYGRTTTSIVHSAPVPRRPLPL